MYTFEIKCGAWTDARDGGSFVVIAWILSRRPYCVKPPPPQSVYPSFSNFHTHFSTAELIAPLTFARSTLLSVTENIPPHLGIRMAFSHFQITLFFFLFKCLSPLRVTSYSSPPNFLTQRYLHRAPISTDLSLLSCNGDVESETWPLSPSAAIHNWSPLRSQTLQMDKKKTPQPTQNSALIREGKSDGLHFRAYMHMSTYALHLCYMYLSVRIMSGEEHWEWLKRGRVINRQTETPLLNPWG